MINVAVLFLRGGCASTAILPAEIFQYAGVFWNLLNSEPANPQFRVTTASSDGKPVRIDPLISITPQCAISELDTPDLVFVPAGGLELEMLLETGYDIDAVIGRNAEVVGCLRQWAANGVQIAGACSGVALMAEAGLLDNKQATMHWALADIYRERFPDVDWQPQCLVTDNGDVYCGGGINAAADLSLYLVEKFCGRETATQCAKALLIEMPRTWQTAFVHFSMRTSHSDEFIHRAQDWLQKHFSEDVQLENLAVDLGMSSRNFARRFKEATGTSPLHYLQTLRIAIAKRLLENNRLPIQDIAEEVGYTDLIFFRNLFKRHTGLSPSDYRKRFGSITTLATAV